MSKKVDPPEDLVRLYEEAVERFPDDDHRAALTLALGTHRRKRSGRRGRPPVYRIEHLFGLGRLMQGEGTRSMWDAAKQLANELPGGGGTVESKAKALMRAIDKFKNSGDLIVIALSYMKSRKYKDELKRRKKDEELGFPRDIDSLARLSRNASHQELRRRGYSESMVHSIAMYLRNTQTIRWYRQIQQSLGPVADMWRQLGAHSRPLWEAEQALLSQKRSTQDVQLAPQVSVVPRWQRQFEPRDRLLGEAEAALRRQQRLSVAADLQRGADLGHRLNALQEPLDIVRAKSVPPTERMPAFTNMVWPGGPGGATDLFIHPTAGLRPRRRRRRRGLRRPSAMRRHSQNRRRTSAV